MKKVATTVLAGLLIAGAALANEGDGNQSKKTEQTKIVPQTTCPIMGGKINKNLYVDKDGKRIFVCCKGCIAPVQTDFAKYAKKIEAGGETVATLQTTCPVMGGKINKELYVDHDGKRVYVCCKGCIAAVKKAPQKYIKKLEAEGVVLEPAGQDENGGEKATDMHRGHNH